MPAPFDAYLTSIAADLKGGHATEHTYRPALEHFMEAVRPGVKASNDPKHIECGAPDFIVEKGKVPLGYVETKDVGADLDKVEKSEQVKRYLKALNNLILTDYLEFRWYVNGVKKRTVSVAKVGKNGKLAREENAALNLEQLFKDFYAEEAPTVTSPKDLAGRLAGVTHFIRDQIIAAFTSGDPAVQKGFETRLSAFRELLLPAIKPEEFADLYAQAMTYGLFAAKLATPLEEKFSLLSAYQYLGGNGFLRKLFMDVSEELDEIEIIRPYLQDIVSLLNRADFGSILATFGRRTRTEDPVVHFYETFLAAYDPKLRESRGVYYTPEPVVQFIVRSVDELLKTRFGKPWGLADSSVKVLDPATGTGTFLYFVIQQIHDEVVETRKQAGQWPQVSKELLGRLFGFELLMAPYVVAHLKLGMQLKELGAPLGKHERVQVYLTNALEEGVSRAEQLAGLGGYIAEESSEAAQVKKREDIMVVLGNPPYSVTSANSGAWITNLVRDGYYPHDDIKEQNPKLLLDDYVKFIRFGEWRIKQTGFGILAFITNHAYLDNPTFRSMREHLMKTFDEIYILDLHGNSKKMEKTPDGGKDENVFDIQQGVAIILAIRNENSLRKGEIPSTHSKLFHSSLWGTRVNKHENLLTSNLKNICWKELNPTKPFTLFVPQNDQLVDEYKAGWRITDIFPVSSTGIKTHRDHFVIDFDLQPLRRRIADFRNLNIHDDHIRREYILPDTRDWKLHSRRVSFSKVKDWESVFIHCLYRPFDIRNIYYHDDIIELARSKVMSNMLVGSNIGLVATRQVTSLDFGHILCSELIIEMKTCSHDRGTDFFPLYLYTTPEDTAGTLFAQAETTRKANLSPAFLAALSAKLGIPYVEDPGPLRPAAAGPQFAPQFGGGGGGGVGAGEVFCYAYAVFHSPTYRSRYAEFLKIDFPRLPLTGDRALFFTLAEKGRQLVALHLLKTPLVEEFITAYPAGGDNRVEKVVFVPDAKRPGFGRVQINPRQYFDGVPEAVWAFKIGGYQVCEKWLKDRKGRVLSSEDINHYQRVIVALQGTIRLMAEIDAAIPGWPME
jgi:hypothetical protein